MNSYGLSKTRKKTFSFLQSLALEAIHILKGYILIFPPSSAGSHPRKLVRKWESIKILCSSRFATGVF